MSTIVILQKQRQQALFDELSYALRCVSKDEVQRWGMESVKLFGNLTVNRVKGLGKTLWGVGNSAFKGAVGMQDAYTKGRLGEHSKTLVQCAAESTRDFVSQTAQSITKLKEGLQNNPKEVAPALAVYSLAFLSASGGIDGDGGVPDLDLALGIGFHRSIFTHSILAGATVATFLAATATLVGMVYSRLPEQHDPIWDSIHKNKEKYLEPAMKGASLGIAYHLLVDAIAQPAPYHGLPISMPLAAHQTTMGANAVAEAIDATKKDGLERIPQS